MMASANQQNLVSSNQKYVSTFDQGSLALPPAKKYAVVTCMDARIDPVRQFVSSQAQQHYEGIPIGDAHIIRNAGGSAVEGLRSLIISEQLLGTQEIFVIKHTGCGMLTFQNADARAVVEKNLGSAAGQSVSKLDFLPFPTLEQAVVDDIAFIKAQPAIPDGIVISGWIYEVETGKVRQVA